MSSRRGFHLASTFLVSIVLAGALAAQQAKPPDELPPEVDGNSEIGSSAAPDRRPGEGEGPFERLVIRGATMIDGTGAPPQGPIDIVIESNRIKEVKSVGFPDVADSTSRARPAQGRRGRSTAPACT